MAVRLFPFACGWWNAEPGFFLEGEGGEPLKSPVPAFLIDHPAGLAVFDTGLGETARKPGPTREMMVRVAQLEFDDKDDIAAQITAAGRDPMAVRWIINSHFHSDHCGGNASLPNASIIVQRAEVDFARANADGMIYAADLFETGQPLTLIDGEHDLFGDGTVMVLPTFGHTPGHQSALVRLADGDVMLTADCCYLKRSLDEMRLSPGNWDQARSLATLTRLRDMRERGIKMVYGHDAGQWRQKPYEVPFLTKPD